MFNTSLTKSMKSKRLRIVLPSPATTTLRGFQFSIISAPVTLITNSGRRNHGKDSQSQQARHVFCRIRSFSVPQVVDLQRHALTTHLPHRPYLLIWSPTNASTSFHDYGRQGKHSDGPYAAQAPRKLQRQDLSRPPSLYPRVPFASSRVPHQCWLPLTPSRIPLTLAPADWTQ